MPNNLENLFTEEDTQELEQIQKMRKNILKNIGLSNFIDLIRNLIDDSEDFEFTSASKRKFISLNTPIFTIRKKGYIYDEKRLSKKSEQSIEINKIVKEINEQILDKTTLAILTIINEDETLKKIYGDINETLRGLLWTTVFEIKVSLKDNIIYMRYCI
jgi:hypothetical protein